MSENPSSHAAHIPDLRGSRQSRFLVSQRLYLREVRISDVGDHYYAWMNTPEITRFLESRFYPHSIEQLREYVEIQAEDPDIVFLAIVLSEGDRHIGNLKLGPVDWIHRRAEIGILIGEEDCWGQGYASEAIALAADYAFRRLNLHKLTAGCYETNHGSVKAFEKAGFKREGVRSQHYFADGAYVDAVLLGRIRPA